MNVLCVWGTMQRNKKMDLFPFQTRFPFDLTEIIAIDYLPTGQLHSLRNGWPHETNSQQYSGWIQGRPNQNVRYHLSPGSKILCPVFSPSKPCYVNLSLLVSATEGHLSPSGWDNMLVSSPCRSNAGLKWQCRAFLCTKNPVMASWIFNDGVSVCECVCVCVFTAMGLWSCFSKVFNIHKMFQILSLINKLVIYISWFIF